MKRDELLTEMNLEQALFGTLVVFSSRLQAVGDAFYKEITIKQFILLICLSVFIEPPTINELSEMTGSSHQNVKVILEKLAEKGYVGLYKDDVDKRKVRVVLTEKAESLAKKHQERENEFLGQFFSGCNPDELRTTYRTISNLENNLKEIRKSL
jgi:DNA-binding MarR family transcriptional regulator